MTQRPSDEKIERLVTHFIDAAAAAAPEESRWMRIVADHLRWAIGRRPHFYQGMPAELEEIIAECDKLDGHRGTFEQN